MGLFIRGERYFEGGIETQSIRLSAMVELWGEALKLRVMDFHFYQRSAFDWKLEVGDMYCLTRFGMELFIVSRISHLNMEMLPTEQSVVYVKHLVDSNGKVIRGGGTGPVSTVAYADFVSGGFSVHRLVIPRMFWNRQSAATLMPLQSPKVTTSDPMGDEERAAFDALAAGDAVPQLGTPWPAGLPVESTRCFTWMPSAPAMDISDSPALAKS